MTHDDGVQEKKICMGPVVSVVVLVELSGMGCEWECASIVVVEPAALFFCLVLCPLGCDGGNHCSYLLQPQHIHAAACRCKFLHHVGT